MEADLSRLPTGTSGWLALVTYATSLGDLAEVDWFELKGALSFAGKSARKRSAVIVSRAILGMSNRMPDIAQKHLGGSGIILVGIDNATVVGTEAVDGAVLAELIEPYVGADGPHWDYQFINHEEGLVLAFVVDPPQWGDRAFPCRKEFQDNASKLAVRDGDIFVRIPGMTRPASSNDLAQLDLRRSRAPHTGAKVNVEYDATFDRVDTESIRKLVEGKIDQRADSLLSDLEPVPTPNPPLGSGIQALALRVSSWSSDSRSKEAFRTEVGAWRAESKAFIDEVPYEFFRHRLARGRLLIRNGSLRYLEGVRVRVIFPPGVMVVMGSDTAYCDHGGPFNMFKLLPDPPYRYGDVRHGMAPRINQFSPDIANVTTPTEIEESASGAVISWQVGELPGEASENCNDVFAVVTDDHVDEIIAKWTVTARGIDHVFQGQLRLSCEQDPQTHLRWGRGS